MSAKRVRPLTQRGSSHRIIKRVDAWKDLGRLGICSIATLLFWPPVASYLGEIQAQTAAVRAPGAHSNPSNGDNQLQQSATPPVLPNRLVDQAIPLPTIADRAEELEHLLREISS